MRNSGRLLTILLIGMLTVLTACSGGASTTATVPPPPPPPPPPVDTTPPSVAIDSPSSTGSFTTTSDNVIVSGTASDNVGVTRVTSSLNGGTETDASGLDNWSTSALSLNNGDNNIDITATDAAGNDDTMRIVVTRTAAADMTPPSVTITSPSSTGTFSTTDDNVIVSGTASDNVGVTRVTSSLNGGPATDASGLENWSTSVLLLNNGDNNIDITAQDAAGNVDTDQIVVTRNSTSPVLQGVAILGDSNSDEFRADDNRGGAFAATTLNWMEQLVIYRGINFGVWGTRSEPRRSGYEFNWARSGATASSMISAGQHTGVAQQVAAGDVTLVIVYIGANDFLRQNYDDIYNGVLSGAALDNKISAIVANITTAVDTVQGAGQVEILLSTLFDYSLNVAGFFFAYPDAARRQTVTDAIRSVNSGLVNMAQQRGVAVFDITANAAIRLNDVDQNGFINVGGELINTLGRGNEPHNLVLGDASGHGGTVSNGFTANDLFIDAVNNAFGTTIVPFTDQEILTAAGITP